MGEVVGAGLLSHAPTMVLPESTRRELNRGNDTTLVAGLIGAVGEGECRAKARQYDEYENSVGTGQVHLWFDRPEEGFPRPRGTHLEPLTAEQPSMQNA
jgi:hypothetical protein